jgi:Domain of unknown function (DUF397)
MSNSNDASLSWRKSSFSGSGDCIEIASCRNFIMVRDSKQRHSHILEFTNEQWHLFLDEIRAGSVSREYPQSRKSGC